MWDATEMRESALVCAGVWGVPVEALQGRSGVAEVQRARETAIVVAMELGGWSVQAVTGWLGGSWRVGEVNQRVRRYQVKREWGLEGVPDRHLRVVRRLVDRGLVREGAG